MPVGEREGIPKGMIDAVLGTLFHTVVAKGNGGKRSGTSRWWRKQAAGVKRHSVRLKA